MRDFLAFFPCCRVFLKIGLEIKFEVIAKHCASHTCRFRKFSRFSRENHGQSGQTVPEKPTARISRGLKNKFWLNWLDRLDAGTSQQILDTYLEYLFLYLSIYILPQIYFLFIYEDRLSWQTSKTDYQDRLSRHYHLYLNSSPKSRKNRRNAKTDNKEILLTRKSRIVWLGLLFIRTVRFWSKKLT